MGLKWPETVTHATGSVVNNQKKGKEGMSSLKGTSNAPLKFSPVKNITGYELLKQ